MNIFLMILLIAVGMINMYCGHLHLKLYNQGIIRTDKKISLKIINYSMSEAKSEENKNELKVLKSIYCIGIAVFYGFIILLVLHFLLKVI